MVDRKASVIGTSAMSLIYWGALIWWLKDPLQSADSLWALTAAKTKALKIIGVSFPYVLFIIWGTQTDLPENIAEMPYVGRMLKPVIWLAFMVFFFAWGWVDPSVVGFLLVGVGLLGLASALALVCLMYSGPESSRLYALERLVDVYPSITKPEGHVRFNQKLWTTTLVLIIYFMMTNVMIWGLSDTTLDVF